MGTPGHTRAHVSASLADVNHSSQVQTSARGCRFNGSLFELAVHFRGAADLVPRYTTGQSRTFGGGCIGVRVSGGVMMRWDSVQGCADAYKGVQMRTRVCRCVGTS
eukprot:2214882-Rhodomonas_salina.1